ncbi:MAG: ATP-binding cassette domain-containing protein [Caldithrix sp.]|nr:ATP-binding cassette domain-containing protein [Caldithrix sp.]
MMNNAVLKLDDINFAFEENQVLKDISCSVFQGEFMGIIGPNGAGKSTLIKLIAGLSTAGAGKIQLFNQPIGQFDKKSLARRIGYVPQHIDISFPFTVEEVVAMGRYPHLRGFINKDTGAAQSIEKAMQWMDLQPLRHRPFNALSGGEKQRTVIGSVLAQEADIFLLDEPTSALDLNHQQGIYRRLKRLSAEEGKTIIIVTHDVNLAAQFCPRLFLMHQGRCVRDGAPQDVLQFRLIEEVYGVKVYIDINPFTDSVYILPYDSDENLAL